MKTIKVLELPTCDICKEKPASYDAKMAAISSFANFCDDCFKTHADRGMATKLVQHTPVELQNDGQIYDAKEDTNVDEVITDGCLRVVSCSKCGEDRTVEPDAEYIFNCTGCGVKVKVQDIMETMFV